MTDKNNVKTTGNTDMESRILEAAKAVFMEKGFAETSMGDIAARAGINRPSLHYYFRTKDRIFQAVFGMIIQKVVPKVERFITAQDVPLSERVASLVDVYYETFRNNPTLPLFIARELNRDVDHIIETIHDTPMRVTLMKIVSSLRAEMAAGKLNTVAAVRTVLHLLRGDGVPLPDEEPLRAPFDARRRHVRRNVGTMENVCRPANGQFAPRKVNGDRS